MSVESNSKRTLWSVTALLAIGFASASAGVIDEDFNAGLPAGATLHGSASATGTAIQLTPFAFSQLGGLSFTDQDAGFGVLNFVAEFDFQMTGGSGGADGISLSFSRLGVVGAAGEEGIGSGLALGLDTWNNGAGDDFSSNHASLRFDGFLVAVNSALPLDLNDGGIHHARMEFDMGLVDVYLDPDGATPETQIFFGEALPGWTPYAGQFNFGARTGGARNAHIIDDFLAITTSEIPEPTTLSLCALGLLGVVRRRVRRVIRE
jgi:hypothetical protein